IAWDMPLELTASPVLEVEGVKGEEKASSRTAAPARARATVASRVRDESAGQRRRAMLPCIAKAAAPRVRITVGASSELAGHAAEPCGPTRAVVMIAAR